MKDERPEMCSPMKSLAIVGVGTELLGIAAGSRYCRGGAIALKAEQLASVSLAFPPSYQ